MEPPQSAFPTVGVSAQSRAEAKAQLLMRLRARSDVDLALLRAMEAAPRENFVDLAYADLALRDVAVPLPFGQTMEAPSALARMIAALNPRPDSRVLEIGAGSGYSAKVLSLLAREVVSVDCFERLALDARGRLELLGVANVAVVWADCFEISPAYGLFDRILIHGAIDEVPANIAGALGEGGVMAAASRRAGEEACELMRFTWSVTGGLDAQSLGPWRAQRLLRGLFSER
ncbi:protein-L-isoaspartate O-methyltransferase [Rhodoblastus acidophilus]|uniref:Protein-L-isoaspartate O-methyltransferase n=1 Tax=Candidatus Rhodoblastus alkanivorans TaxID=2954117 RepID=A0ABS9Z7X0_9HYPH|nr:rRNA adenine N-6-methyltransferase family protein [Candidatus Rhodoblastus alkanivorans]MCI4679546.1 protein-L-isoaspartate O-methyltransferase [Candidatus Rhodoblastus alkanivorans]MCI4683297.1 protein-L-isoaspartate O-methyltransferase [Candidatus Rhodoblastus alkanivorans]MDI4640610.1 protein-L-isoaspartate O-methyltransferase [Rhodoblastus acidophilus]